MTRVRSWVITEAVMAMTGVGLVTGSARSRCRASIPLMPGSWMSIKMSAGCRSWARRTPSSPVSASMVWYPLTCSVSRTSFKFLGLSSTMRMSSFAMTHRDRERERRAHADLALHPDPPTMEFDELPAQSEPQPRPLRLLLRRPDLTELLEHGLLILWRNADTGVAH